MRRTALVTAALIALLVPGAAVAATGRTIASAPGGSGASQPSRTEISRAVARATRSSYLWATVNICLPKPHVGGLIGIRGEMPALGFTSTLAMTIQLQQYVTKTHRYAAVTGSTAHRTVTLGPRVRGIHQGGAEFPYASETGRLRAAVTFTWTRAGRRLATVSRTTTGGHPSAAYGEPPRTSMAACRL